MKHTDIDLSDSIGEPKPEPKKQRTRKPRKQNQKELLNEYYTDVEKERDNSAAKQRKLYDNMQYLSGQEKALFEQKFTQPKNFSQERYVGLLKQKSKKIVVATGPAGTGKTMFATEFGVRNFLLGTYEKLIFTRPSVSVDEDLGYLPGTLEEKMAPWVRPIYDILYQFISPKEVTQLIEEKIIAH